MFIQKKGKKDNQHGKSFYQKEEVKNGFEIEIFKNAQLKIKIRIRKLQDGYKII